MPLVVQVVKIFTGGEGSLQLKHFMVAKSRVAAHLLLHNDIILEFEYINSEDVRINHRWSEKQFVDYFLDCYFHVFLSHPGQGQVNRSHKAEPNRDNPWDMEILLHELERLKGHNGYPFGEFLFDPAFTQNKIKYIETMKEYSIPTLRISLRLMVGRIPLSVRLEIAAFLAKHGNKCCLKLPFTTNSQALKFPEGGLEDVLEKLIQFHKLYGDKIHYAILQPLLPNRKEYKMVFLNGNFSHTAENDKKANPAFAFGTVESRVSFATEILTVLRQRLPGCLFAPLMRFDVMFYDGKMVLNEIESLEAQFSGTGDGNVGGFLEKFWVDLLLYWSLHE